MHNFTPASILHIIGYVALCELFLGCEAHFELWKKLFCLVPCNHGGSIFQVGGAEIWCIAGTGYLSGTPNKVSEEWPSEWFYIEDVSLPDPVRMGLPEFTNALLRKCLNWRPWSLREEYSREVLQLMSKIRILAQSGLSIVEGDIHYERGSATPIPRASHVALQWRRRRHPLLSKGSRLHHRTGGNTV